MGYFISVEKNALICFAIVIFFSFGHEIIIQEAMKVPLHSLK